MNSIFSYSQSLIFEAVSKIQADIIKLAEADMKKASGKHMKKAQPSPGVKHPDLKEIVFKNAWDNYLGGLSENDKKEVAHALLEKDTCEERLVGLFIFDKIPKMIYKHDIVRIEQLFKEGKLAGWGCSDGVSDYVFMHWVQGSIENTRYICEWRNSDCLWLQRASCVTFVNLAKYGDSSPNFPGFMKMLDQVCDRTIQNPERFAQLGTGWLLRNIGSVDKNQLFAFLERNIGFFSREGLSYAIEKLTPAERKKIKAMRKNVCEVKVEEDVDFEAEFAEIFSTKKRKQN